MKNLFFIVSMFVSTVVFADPAEEIYNALDIEAVALNPGIVGASRTEKYVGGLSCIRSLIIVPDAESTYECVLEEKNLLSEEIYNALDVQEVALNPGIVGASRTEKYVGGLSCIRSLIIVPDAEPTFECTLD